MLRLERIREDIAALGRQAAATRQARQDALAIAQRWLAEVPGAEELRGHVQPLLGSTDPWSGAVPVTDRPLNVPIACPPESLTGAVLIGVDGSQIFPDRHALALYYLLQVGALIFRYDGSAPTPRTFEWLRYEESDLFDERGYLIGAETLGMERMVKEMEVLADLVAASSPDAQGPVIGLFDGPLLWPYADRVPDAGSALRTYMGAMRRVQRGGGHPVGYVDRPGGRPLLDLLWASRLRPDEFGERIGESPLHHLTDEDLMVSFLPPGACTPWFTRPTPTNDRHAQEGQEIWFCYVHMGSGEHPTIARIEIPAWATIDGRAPAVAHAALLHQAAALNGYPYVLARAHEEALVTTQDKAALEQAIQREILASGHLALPSEKAQQKALLGRR
jgi:hypothetical protein